MVNQSKASINNDAESFDCPDRGSAVPFFGQVGSTEAFQGSQKRRNRYHRLARKVSFSVRAVLCNSRVRTELKLCICCFCLNTAQLFLQVPALGSVRFVIRKHTDK